MDSKLFRQKLLKIQKELKVAVQAEFEITGLQKIGYEWNLPALKFDFPETDFEDAIVAISKNGVKFETIGFRSWNSFFNLFGVNSPQLAANIFESRPARRENFRNTPLACHGDRKF
jgi:hypothetical protein